MEEEKKIQLNLNYITFGKYKDKDLLDVLKDRKYCSWLIEQDWFKESYEYLYNSLKNYDLKKIFFKEDDEEEEDILENYKYFNLKSVDKLEIKLNEKEIFCYSFYLKMVNKIKNDIKINIAIEKSNPFDIKAPSKWLKVLEEEGKEIEVKRDDFKEFMSCYELQNIPFIIEDIKKIGGFE